MRKSVFRVSDTNRTVQPQKIARGLKFWISEVEGLYYLCCRNPFAYAKNKDTDQLRGNCAADQYLCFCFIDSTIPNLPKYKISSFYPSSVTV